MYFWSQKSRKKVPTVCTESKPTGNKKKTQTAAKIRHICTYQARTLRLAKAFLALHSRFSERSGPANKQARNHSKARQHPECRMCVLYLEHGLDAPGRLYLGDLERGVALAVGLEGHLSSGRGICCHTTVVQGGGGQSGQVGGGGGTFVPIFTILALVCCPRDSAKMARVVRKMSQN